MTLTVHAAARDDAEAVERLIDEAAAWLQSRGIDQWRPGHFRAEVHDAIEANEFYLARQDGLLVGCFRLALNSPPAVKRWLADQGRHADTGAYLSRLTTARAAAGEWLGVTLIDAACDLAAQHGLQYLRLDCWAGNARLRQYYLDTGFDHCADIRTRTRDRAGEIVVISLFERAAGIDGSPVPPR